MLSDLVNRVEHAISGSPRVAGVAARVRNHCDMLVGYHFAPSNHGDRNGEHWLLGTHGTEIRRFVDAGANVGDWAAEVLARNPRAAGVCIEPGLDAVQRLRARLPGVTVVEAAVGAEPGMLRFWEEPEAGERSSLVAGQVHGQARDIRVTTIDAVLEARGWDSVDFLKIDVEGYDGLALHGARRTLQAGAGVVQFEYNRPWARAGTTLGGTMSMLAAHGYETFVLRPQGLERFDYERFGEFFRYANFVALPVGRR
jgi:FkbM family methyltransferase